MLIIIFNVTFSIVSFRSRYHPLPLGTKNPNPIQLLLLFLVGERRALISTQSLEGGVPR